MLVRECRYCADDQLSMTCTLIAPPGAVKCSMSLSQEDLILTERPLLSSSRKSQKRWTSDRSQSLSCSLDILSASGCCAQVNGRMTCSMARANVAGLMVPNTVEIGKRVTGQ